ncbi:phosphoserine phosphatase SerB [Endozoicomonadaceae bacterium StTr2]
MSEILLINVTGQDRPGMTSAITDTMARYGLIILDIGQSVIHDTLTWGILVRLPDEADQAPVLKDLLYQLHQMELQAKYQSISESAYQSWVEAQGKDQYIITLLSRCLTAEQIARVSDVAARHGLNIDSISRLTGRMPLEEIEEGHQAVVEFVVRGTPSDLDSLKADFLHISSELEVDVAFQQDTVFRRNRRLVVFDMDSTLIEAEVIDELAKAAGVGEQVAEITEAAMRGELDFSESFRKRMALLKGLDESVLESIAESLRFTEGTEKLIRNLKKLGYRTAILPGGFTWFARYLQQKLGIDYVYANELEVVDGKVTGEVSGIIVDGQRKAELMKEIAQKEQVNLEQVIAVGDGANDLPMLGQAGLGIAFRAKPLVRQSARHAISTLGLDAVLYLMGYRDRDIAALEQL